MQTSDMQIMQQLYASRQQTKQAASHAINNQGKDMQIANAIKRYAKNETSVQLGNNAYNKNMQQECACMQQCQVGQATMYEL